MNFSEFGLVGTVISGEIPSAYGFTSSSQLFFMRIVKDLKSSAGIILSTVAA
jgi:hypothetical protein